MSFVNLQFRVSIYCIQRSRPPALLVLYRLFAESAFLGRDLEPDLDFDLVVLVVVVVLRCLMDDVDLPRIAGIATSCSPG